MRTIEAFSLPLFLEIGKNSLESLSRTLKGNGFDPEKAFVLFDKTTYEVAGERVSNLLKEAGIDVEDIKMADSSHEHVEAVRKRIRDSTHGMVFGVGGGKVIDTGKHAAGLEGVNFVSIPTAPSNDGIASPVAVIDGRSLRAKMPVGLFADLDIIMKAPIRSIRAGIGDLIANVSAVEDWRMASRVKGEEVNHFAALLSESGALLVLNSEKPDILSYDFLKRLIYGLVLSGIAIHLAGSSRPSSGGEHEISHAIDALYPGKALHGEQVAVGTLFTLHLQRNGYFDRVKQFFDHCGLPLSCGQLGLTTEEFVEAVAYAPNTREGRHTVLEELHLSRDEIEKAVRDASLIS